MRARMGLFGADIEYEHREIILRDKPAHMLEISPKGTVPVLLLPTGQVIDESLDIMQWALSQNDPCKWLPDMHRHDIYSLIGRNDEVFKTYLDRYKYPNRYPDEPDDTLGTHARDNAYSILNDLDQRIANNGALSGDTTSLADIAIFPFIRQFAHVDRDWFYSSPQKNLQKWLQKHLQSTLFSAIMQKHKLWQSDSTGVQG